MVEQNEGYGLSPEIIERIDPNIRGLVIALNQQGIETYSSCEGHVGQPAARLVKRVPWVSFQEEAMVQNDNLSRLSNVLSLWNKSNPTNPWYVCAIEEPITRYESETLYMLLSYEDNFGSSPEVLQELQRQALEISHLVHDKLE